MRTASSKLPQLDSFSGRHLGRLAPPHEARLETGPSSRGPVPVPALGGQPECVLCVQRPGL